MNPASRIASRNDFHQALQHAFAHAADVDAREIWLSDPDFADWPLDEAGVLANLTRWAPGRQRRLVLLASNFDELARRHLRWLQWRRVWSHLVQCRGADIESAKLPTLLLLPGETCVRLVDRVHYRGGISGLPAELNLAREQLDAVLQRSAEALPVTTLGL